MKQKRILCFISGKAGNFILVQNISKDQLFVKHQLEHSVIKLRQGGQN